MVPPIPLTSGSADAPSAAWLVCAACGPLRADHAAQGGITLGDEPGVERVERCYVVEEGVSYPTLRRWVAENKPVQEAMALIEAARSRDGGKKRPLSHAEMAGSARANLLLGKERAFLQRYKSYVRTRAYEWHPDPEHVLFWDRVLGPGWAGSAWVPEGEARDEVVLLSASAHAFCSPPPECARGRGLCGAPEHEDWLEIAAALRMADGASIDERMFEGSDSARAASQLLGGIFESAQEDFEHIFGRAEDNRYALVQNHGLPLLIYALVGGVFAGGSQRFLRSWFEMARYALPFVYPPSMSCEEGQLIRFLNHLEQVDSLVNRGGSMAVAPQFNGALSCLPFAMFHASLPGYVQQTMDSDLLAEAVLQLAVDGLRLLALYGALGLRQAAGLSPEQKARLEALLEQEEVFPTLPPPPVPATQRALEELMDTVLKYSRRSSKLQQTLLSVPPTLVASRMATGVAIDLLADEQLDECDNSPALRCMKKHADRDGVLLLEGESLAGFTRLFAALLPQVDVVGSLALPDEPVAAPTPQAVLLLAHEGKGRCVAALRLRLLPGAEPLMAPGFGLDVPVLELPDGSTRAVRRDARAEWAFIEQTAERLQQAGSEAAEGLILGMVSLSGFRQLGHLLSACRACGIESRWEKGYALNLHQPQAGLTIHTGPGCDGWLELGGGLPVDEGRVLELCTLLEHFAEREGNTLCLGDGEYVLLTPALERQLTLLELVWQEKQGKRGVAAAALHLLQALEGEEKAAESSPVPAPLPPDLQATLRPYQAEGFRWLAERVQLGLGALLADDMGLGKTVQLLALLLHSAAQQGAGASLVVAPVSLLGNWAEEAARFAPSLNITTYDPKKPDALESLRAGCVVLASYGQIASRQADFAAVSWEVVVLDEAQTIKNPDSQRARAVYTLSARARVCLTGTPVENSLLDLWSQMRFLNPGLLGNRAAFLKRFRKAGADELHLLRQVLAPLLLRRTKGEVLTQLPPLTETIEWVEFSREERTLYESLRRDAMAKLGKGQGGGKADISILAELTRLRRACCHGKLALADFVGDSAKLLAMAERVGELRAAGRRVLIFSQFTDVLDLAQELLQRGGISCLRLDGGTPATRRSKVVKAFQEGRADAFLISLKAGGAGLNLTAADYVMLLDPWWNPAVEAQAAGRSHRMGQAHPVTLCRFMVRGTVEERILALHGEKKELAEQILSGTGDGMSLANLRALLG